MKRIVGFKLPDQPAQAKSTAGAAATNTKVSPAVIRPQSADRRLIDAAVCSLLAVSGLLSAACSSATKPSFEGDGENRLSIASLKTRCTGNSTTLTRNATIQGIVTANDIRGEFPKAIILEDATGGIEIAIDHTALADLFPLGSEISVHCSGLALGSYGGKVQLGAPPTGQYSVDRIARADIGRYLRCMELNAGTRRPRTTRFAELGIADADAYVRFEKVCFAETGSAWCDRDPESDQMQTTLRTLIDDAGNTFSVRVLPSCHYAAEPVPQGTGSVNGIIDYFNGELSLRIINYEIDLATFAAHPTTSLSTAECSIPKRKR